MLTKYLCILPMQHFHLQFIPFLFFRNALRITQTGRLADTSGSEEKVFLGSHNRDFQFSDLKGISVDFVECSALEPGDDNELIKPIVEWLSKIAQLNLINFSFVIKIDSVFFFSLLHFVFKSFLSHICQVLLILRSRSYLYYVLLCSNFSLKLRFFYVYAELFEPYKCFPSGCCFAVNYFQLRI